MTEDEFIPMPLKDALLLVIEASMHCSPAKLPGFDQYPIDICRENYNAMAAAPEMLAALKSAKWMLERDFIDPQKLDIIRKCEAAISKGAA